MTETSSKMSRLRQFYAANPTEELRYVDIAVKLDCQIRYARQMVIMLRKEGLLEVVHVVRCKANNERV